MLLIIISQSAALTTVTMHLIQTVYIVLYISCVMLHLLFYIMLLYLIKYIIWISRLKCFKAI